MLDPILDFCIIGAPKCGTTSLAGWLDGHPEIFMSKVKEPGYFVSDHTLERLVTTEEDYRELFANAERYQLCGEATTSYLHSEVAVPALLTHNRNISLIVMVRNPLDMAPSLHAQYVWNTGRGVPDSFEEAWRRNSERSKWFNYREACSLGAQLMRLYQIVDPRQVHVIVFDDLMANPRAIYEQTLAFLGLASDGRTDFRALNQRKQRRWELADHLLRHPPAILASAKRALLSVAPRGAKRLRRKLNELNAKPLKREPISRELSAEMAECFAPDVAKLGLLLNRDLNHWVKL